MSSIGLWTHQRSGPKSDGNRSRRERSYSGVALTAATRRPELARPVSVTTMPTIANAAETLASGAEGVRLALDAIGIGVITIGAAAALGGMVRARLHGERVRFTAVRLVLARYLALGLEFQLAADVVDTAISPEWKHIGQLAAIATIRTALNYFLGKEMREERESLTEPAPPTQARVAR